MVRRIGVSHKSLLVPDVTAGSYAIKYEHLDYLPKEFNITVGDGLPTTFTQGMTEKVYSIDIELPSLALFSDNTIVQGDALVFNTFRLRNIGNTTMYGWYTLKNAGLGMDLKGIVGPLAPGSANDVSVPNQTITAAPGQYEIGLAVGPSPTNDWNDVMPLTDACSKGLTVTEWVTDVTFIATAPGIPDLHGVEIFIDGTSMGTT